MIPKCGRIDVKYANCSYHTRIGPGKWTHDPNLYLAQNYAPFAVSPPRHMPAWHAPVNISGTVFTAHG